MFEEPIETKIEVTIKTQKLRINARRVHTKIELVSFVQYHMNQEI